MLRNSFDKRCVRCGLHIVRTFTWEEICECALRSLAPAACDDRRYIDPSTGQVMTDGPAQGETPKQGEPLVTAEQDLFDLMEKEAIRLVNSNTARIAIYYRGELAQMAAQNALLVSERASWRTDYFEEQKLRETAERRVSELEAALAAWEQVWSNVKRDVPDLRENNKPLAVAATYELQRAALAEKSRDAERLKDVALQAITSIGSFDGGLQAHYQRKFHDAIAAERKEGKDD